MKTDVLKTRYGTLHGVERAEYDREGRLRACTLTEENRVKTAFGELTPQYEDDGVRRKYTNSLSFYPTGELKSISLQTAAKAETSQGALSAELLTFYRSGALKRLFPLNGKLSGFWSEANEYALASAVSVSLRCGGFQVKPISLYFYESGKLKSVTVWPREHPALPTPAGPVVLRTGASFYETGELCSIEPESPVEIPTPAGVFSAFDSEAQGVCGDCNSLVFEKSGEVASLKTCGQTVRVAGGRVGQAFFAPAVAISHFSDSGRRIIPLRVRFAENAVFFNEEGPYSFSDCKFSVSAFAASSGTSEDGCEGCGSFHIS